jgi:flagellar assembly protein FliH
LPNLFKSLRKSPINPYRFPEIADEPEESREEPEEAEKLGEAAVEESSPEKEEEQANAAGVISYAKVQADEIVADAKRQAEEILEQARQKGEEEAARAREEAHGEGYRQGYGEGLKQAQLENQTKLEQLQREQADQLQRVLEQATQAREEMLQNTQEELRDLSIAIAEKVIHVSLKSSRSVIARMIQASTEKLRRREWVHIYVGGVRAGEAAEITPDLVTALSGLSEHIKIIPMPEDEPGTCIIEMPDEIIDASASTQIQNIRQLLSES